MSDDPSPDTTEADDAASDDASDDDASDDGSTDEQPRDKNALEWGVTIAGGLIVAFVIGFFVYELVAGASGPADLVVSLGEPTVDNLTVEVPIEVHNEGQAVAEVVVATVCAGPDACAEITFDYVPYQSTVTGVVGLEAPLRAPLTARVVSYVDP